MKKDGRDLKSVGPGSGAESADADPRIRIRIVLMRIRNTEKYFEPQTHNKTLLTVLKLQCHVIVM